MNGKISCHDQGIINHVCKNKIKTISCTYNVMTPFFYLSSLQIKEIFELKDYYNDIEIKEAISHPHILHFTAGGILEYGTQIQSIPMLICSRNIIIYHLGKNASSTWSSHFKN